MKILNQTYRGVLQEEYPIEKTPVSDLTEATEINPGSLIHLVQIIDEDRATPRYESMKVRMDVFQNKVYEAVQNTFKTAYWDTHLDPTEGASKKHEYNESADRPEGSSFREMVEYLNSKGYAPKEVAEDDWDNFVKHVYYDFDVLKRYIVLNDDNIQNQIDVINEKLIELDCYFDQTMKFHTTKSVNNTVLYSDESVNHKKTENDSYCQMSIKEGNKISNEWTCPATGNLVVYGWLDSSEALDNKAIPSAFCVLEAKIESPTSAVDKWEIIGVSPVLPAKSITYVGFNAIVHEGLVVRARTGFSVGAKSGQYSNENDGYDTLANNTPNGFKCMIYSNFKYESETERTQVK